MPSAVRFVRMVDNSPIFLRQAAEDADGKAEKAVKSGVEFLKGIMPRRTGAMIESTEPVRLPRGWAVKIGVDYWDFVNSGTIFIEGQHFVEKAIEYINANLAHV